MKTRQDALKEYYKKTVVFLRRFVTIQIAKVRMYLGIKAAIQIHKHQSKQYLNPDYKTLKQYIVLLDRPVRKKKYYFKREGKKIKLMYKINSVSIQERLFWINYKNFKKIKRAGWLPRTMKVEDLKNKAFYVSSLTRNYQDEYKARQQATTKYINYLKST